MDIYAKNFFLTYPRCELSPEYALQAFRSLPHSGDLVWCLVVQEDHQDGSKHLHAALNFKKRIRIRDANYFDLHFDDTWYHGNYQSTKSVKNTLAYLRKDPIAEASWGPVPQGSNNPWALAVNTAESQDDFLRQIREHDPMRYVLYHDKVKSYAEQYFGGNGSGYDPVRDLASFSVPSELTNWVDTQLNSGVDRPLSLILVGPSRLGKTEWARSLGRHLYFNGLFDLGQIADVNLPDVRYAVFDDFSWSAMANFYKQWFGAQRTFTVTDKYKAKKTIQWGKPIIWLCNPEVEHELPMNDWMSKNTFKFYLENKLY